MKGFANFAHKKTACIPFLNTSGRRRVPTVNTKNQQEIYRHNHT